MQGRYFVSRQTAAGGDEGGQVDGGVDVEEEEDEGFVGVEGGGGDGEWEGDYLPGQPARGLDVISDVVLAGEEAVRQLLQSRRQQPGPNPYHNRRQQPGPAGPADGSLGAGATLTPAPVLVGMGLGGRLGLDPSAGARAGQRRLLWRAIRVAAQGDTRWADGSLPLAAAEHEHAHAHALPPRHTHTPHSTSMRDAFLRSALHETDLLLQAQRDAEATRLLLHACRTLRCGRAKAMQITATAPWIISYRPERSQRVLGALAVSLGMSRHELSRCVATYPRLLSLSPDGKITAVLRALAATASSIYLECMRGAGDLLGRCHSAKSLADAAVGDDEIGEDVRAVMAASLGRGDEWGSQADPVEALLARRRSTVRSMVRAAVLRYPLVLGTSMARIDARLAELRAPDTALAHDPSSAPANVGAVPVDANPNPNANPAIPVDACLGWLGSGLELGLGLGSEARGSADGSSTGIVGAGPRLDVAWPDDPNPNPNPRLDVAWPDVVNFLRRDDASHERWKLKSALRAGAKAEGAGGVGVKKPSNPNPNPNPNPNSNPGMVEKPSVGRGAAAGVSPVRAPVAKAGTGKREKSVNYVVDAGAGDSKRGRPKKAMSEMV